MASRQAGATPTSGQPNCHGMLRRAVPSLYSFLAPRASYRSVSMWGASRRPLEAQLLSPAGAGCKPTHAAARSQPVTDQPGSTSWELCWWTGMRALIHG